MKRENNVYTGGNNKPQIIIIGEAGGYIVQQKDARDGREERELSLQWLLHLIYSLAPLSPFSFHPTINRYPQKTSTTSNVQQDSYSLENKRWNENVTCLSHTTSTPPPLILLQRHRHLLL
jgi:hypothetical protein